MDFEQCRSRLLIVWNKIDVNLCEEIGEYDSDYKGDIKETMRQIATGKEKVIIIYRLGIY